MYIFKGLFTLGSYSTLVMKIQCSYYSGLTRKMKNKQTKTPTNLIKQFLFGDYQRQTPNFLWLSKFLLLKCMFNDLTPYQLVSVEFSQRNLSSLSVISVWYICLVTASEVDKSRMCPLKTKLPWPLSMLILIFTDAIIDIGTLTTSKNNAIRAETLVDKRQTPKQNETSSDYSSLDVFG